VVTTLEQATAVMLLPQRVAVAVTGVLGLLGLVLAAVGLYGVLAYTALRRLREMAVRIAFGARPAHIRGLVFGHGFKLFGIGVALGAVGVAATAHLIRSFLFGVTPIDPQVFAIVGVTLSVITALAAWLPARRAARVNPIVALRAE
jgi:ABC-type antimicrobial peptide transport system permease subunit